MKTNITQFFYKKSLLLRGIRKISRSNFQFLSGRQQRKLIKRVQKLYRQLNSNHRFKQLKPAVATALLAAGFTFNSAQAQDFSAAPVSNPFGFQSNTPGVNISFPEAVDLDNDGDLDLITGGIFYEDYYLDEAFSYYENIGTATEPEFAPGQLNPFGLTGSGLLNFASHGDIDNDGDMDLITSEYNEYGSSFNFFENIGTPESPEFSEPVLNPFGMIVPEGSLITNAEISDLDSDGDLDILYTTLDNNFGPALNFIENNGTPEQADFMDPISSQEIGIPQNNFFIVNSGDLDRDGDIDIMIGTFGDYSYEGFFLYYENITEEGDFLNFESVEIGPFGLPICQNYCAPDLVDIDNDGDQDLLVGDANGFSFFENVEELPTAPTTMDNSIDVTEDSTYYFQISDISFEDLNSMDSLQAVLITSLPTNGVLKLGEDEISENFGIEVAELQNLNYFAGENQNGEAFDSFTIKVSDGELFSEEESTITINVLAVNDSPSFTLESDTLCPNWQSLTSNLLDISDVDGDDLSFTTLTDDPQLEEASVAYNAGENTAVVDFTPAWNAEGIVAIPIVLSDGTEMLSKTIYLDFECVLGVGIDDLVSEKDVDLFPNPASGFVNIEWKEAESQDSRIEVYDLQSKLVMHLSLTPGKRQMIDVSNLASSHYLVKWTAGDKVALKQLVVE